MDSELVVSRELLIKLPHRLPLPNEWYEKPLKSRPLNKMSQNDRYWVTICYEIFDDGLQYVARPYHESPLFIQEDFGVHFIEVKDYLELVRVLERRHFGI